MSGIKLTITNPCDSKSIIDYSLDFRVDGIIESNESLKENCILKVDVLDESGKIIRSVSQNKKNNENLFVKHPELTAYEESIDPEKKGLLDFGFPELMVRDIDNPYESLKDASIKCFYNDKCFKALIISATDENHGAPGDDGIGFVDEQGIAFNVIPEGDYTIVVSLSSAAGEELARTQKEIHIVKQDNRVIFRLNPISHREKAMKWAKDNDYSIIENWLPGYLEPYMGQWFYHMGLLRMYRANDLGLCNSDKIRMFVYLDDPTSTSYETELAYLQTKGVVGDSNRFFSYYYDIGEAIFGKEKAYEREARICMFNKDESMKITRVDKVNTFAKENVLNLNEEAVIDALYDIDKSSITVKAGERIAITGVVKPMAIDKKYIKLKSDNTYQIDNRIETLVYTFSSLDEIVKCERKLMMERIDGESSIGLSVFEFYNIFEIGDTFKGKKWKVEIKGLDSYGNEMQVSSYLNLIVV